MDLEQSAHNAGLDLVGAVPVSTSPDWTYYETWAHQGYAAGMTYLTRQDALEKRYDPRRIFPDACTVLVVAASYGQGTAREPGPFDGSVSRYAWGEDYHNWLLQRLELLVDTIQQQSGTPLKSRCYVDTGPILERSWAQLAGLGWIGKNTCLIHPQFGSYIFLGVALLDMALQNPRSKTMPACGTCTRCLDACPTGALVAPGVLDANRCLSYLTIEHRASIPVAWRSALGQRVFGCDVCQDVCPWNRKIERQDDAMMVQNATLDLRTVLEMDSVRFHKCFRASSLWRATPEGLARNAAVVLGNQQDRIVLDYVQMMAQEHKSALVREHLRWAERQLRSR